MTNDETSRADELSSQRGELRTDGSPTAIDDSATPTGERERAGSPGGPPSPLSAALGRCRDDPGLFVPFLLVGIALTVLDWLRLQDPIPALERGSSGNGLDVQIEFAVYPTGVPQTSVPLESLVDLQYPFLAWGLASYVLPLAAIALAGAITIDRAMDDESRHWLEAVGPLFVFALAIDLTNRLLGSIDVLQGMGLWGIPLLALYLFVTVRLFAVPGLLVAGRGLPAAVSESSHRLAGRGWGIFGLVLVFGLGAWLLASVPAVGTLLSTALIAPVHAVTIVTALDLEGASR